MSKTVIFVGWASAGYLDYFIQSGYAVGLLYDQDREGVTEDRSRLKSVHFFFPVKFNSNQTIIGSLSGVFVSRESLIICLYDKYFSASILIAHFFGLKQAQLMSVAHAMVVGNKNYQRKVFSEKYPEITVEHKKIRTFHGAYTFTRKHGFPIIVKPAALSQSRLVHICLDLEDLIKKVSYVLDHISQVYKQNNINRKPEVMVEKYIPGRQFSVDSYVTTEGKIIHTPVCQQILGHDLGLDNFETIYSMYEADVTKEEEALIFETVSKAITSLNVRGLPTHTELRLTPEGECKIIEVNMRAGGFRHLMLKESYDINHIDNVIKIYLEQEPIVHRKLLKHSACPQFWPEREGILESIEGIEKVEQLPSFVKLGGSAEIGKLAGPASKGHKKSLFVILANADKAELMRDIEQTRACIKLNLTSPNP